MGKFSEILSIVLASGFIGQFIFFKSKRRKHRTEADVGEFEALKAQVAHFTQQLKEAYQEADHMQEIIDRQRNRLVEMSRELSEVKIKLIQEEERRAIAEYNECTISNCERRQPPRKTKENESRAKE